MSMFFVGLTSVNTVYCSSALHRSLNGSAHVISRPFVGLSTLLRLSATTHPRGKMPILPEAVIICKLCQTFISYDMCGLRTREFFHWMLFPPALLFIDHSIWSQRVYFFGWSRAPGPLPISFISARLPTSPITG